MSFNIVEISGQAYLKAWEERKYILHLALLPFAIKVICFAVVMFLGLENNVLRQTMVMLPAFFLEGWMMVIIVRLVFYNERWVGKGLSLEKETDRGRYIFAGILLYVLIKMAQNALISPFIETERVVETYAESPDPALLSAVFAGLLLFFFVWLFKFAFIHIPLAAGFSIRQYLSKVSGFIPSVYLIGAWLTCYIPFLLAGVFFLRLLTGLLPFSDNFLVLVMFLVHFSVDLAASSVITICFSLAVCEIMQKKGL